MIGGPAAAGDHALHYAVLYVFFDRRKIAPRRWAPAAEPSRMIISPPSSAAPSRPPCSRAAGALAGRGRVRGAAGSRRLPQYRLPDDQRGCVLPGSSARIKWRHGRDFRSSGQFGQIAAWPDDLQASPRQHRHHLASSALAATCAARSRERGSGINASRSTCPPTSGQPDLPEGEPLSTLRSMSLA